MIIMFHKVKWIKFQTILILLFGLMKLCLSCSRVPDWISSEKSPSDGRYVIKVSGTTDKFEPEHEYTISLMGIQGIQAPHSFEGFFLTVQNEKDLQIQDSTLVGEFNELDDKTKFSEKCRNILTHRHSLQKTKVQVQWKAPNPGSGCILIRATVIEHQNLWYMDDGTLTKRLCEVQQDDIDLQPTILEECCACDEAKYELIFEGKWSRHTHPKDFPADNWRTGFSDIIGSSHTIDSRFWQYGELASEGLKEVAEHGSTRQLENELKEQSDQIRTIIIARGLSHPNVTGQTFAVFRVDSKHHLISLVSMIQPSPDWIVGVSGLELCLPNCSWIEHKVHNLYPWDVGTDGGPSYLSSDEPEKRPNAIRRIKPNYPNDPRSPFYDTSGAPMKPLALLHISRRRIYQRNCEGDQGGSDLMECAAHPWSKWSECSTKCGAGQKYRTRQFKNPSIAIQADCKNSLREEQDCMGGYCNNEEDEVPEMANCRLSEWSDWSSCSASCGKGTRTRTRHILGRNRKKCQSNGYPILQENEECTGNEGCVGDLSEENEIPAECKTSEWSDWTPCSECGKYGISSRSRTVWNSDRERKPSDPDPCDNVSKDENVTCYEQCDTRPDFCYNEPTYPNCGDNSTLNMWYFDVPRQECGLFQAFHCNRDKNKFLTRKECKETCEDKPEINSLTIENLRREGYEEKVDCKVSEWRARPCNVTCGEGYQIKTKEIIQSPRYGGKPCPRKLYRLEKCYIRCGNEYAGGGDRGDSLRRLPPSMSYTLEGINEIEAERCRYSKWSHWSPCSTTCGNNSYRQKTRYLLNSEQLQKCTDRIRAEKCDVIPCY